MPWHSLEAFHQRLRDICENHSGCHAADRSARIENQAQQACSLADRLGILIQPKSAWDDFIRETTDLWLGSEHLVEFSPEEKRYGKITIPPAFGLTPEVIDLPVATAEHGLTGTRQAIEFLHEGKLLPFDVILRQPDEALEAFLGIYPE